MEKRTAFAVCLRLNAANIQLSDDLIDLSHVDNPIRVKFSKLLVHDKKPWISDTESARFRESELRAIADCLDLLNTTSAEPTESAIALSVAYNHTVPCPRCHVAHRVLEDEGEIRCGCGCEFEYELELNIRE